MKKLLFLLVFIVIAYSGSALADIYKQVDADGRVTYSNVKTKGATRLALDPEVNTIKNENLKPKGSAPVAKRTSSPEDFPKIDKQTQSNRDGKRQDILQSELDSEKVALEQARQAYAEGESNPEVYKAANGHTMRNVPKFEEKMKALQADIDSHQNNIKLLQKELESLR